jgi:hypothetical protein
MLATVTLALDEGGGHLAAQAPTFTTQAAYGLLDS